MEHGETIDKNEFGDYILQKLESRDPTTQKSYTEWLTRIYTNTNVKFEDLNRNDLLRKYDLAKRKHLIKPQDKDINKFKSWTQFEDTILNYDLSSLEQEKIINKGKSEIVYEDNTIRIIHPYDEKAACYYGRGTRWCTAATEGANAFAGYNNDGELLILIPKQPQYTHEKYQIHVNTNSYKDEKDSNVNVNWLISERFDIFKWFIDRYPQLKGSMFLMDENELNKKITGFVDKIKTILNNMNELYSNTGKQILDYFRLELKGAFGYGFNMINEEYLSFLLYDKETWTLEDALYKITRYISSYISSHASIKNNDTLKKIFNTIIDTLYPEENT